ncbi:MAG: hypothetical protein ACKVP7_19370 [Hyphomicrobiaceae bacterium]
MSRTVVAALLSACLMATPGIAEAQQTVPASKQPNPKPGCIIKAGEATGITRGFAEYEALLIIRQVTGNWPLENDRIGPATYACRQGTVGWTCKAVAQVCKR